MAYKKRKTDMSREELENRLEWLSADNRRLSTKLELVNSRYNELELKYYAVPAWIRRFADSRTKKK